MLLHDSTEMPKFSKYNRVNTGCPPSSANTFLVVATDHNRLAQGCYLISSMFFPSLQSCKTFQIFYGKDMLSKGGGVKDHLSRAL